MPIKVYASLDDFFFSLSFATLAYWECEFENSIKLAGTISENMIL